MPRAILWGLACLVVSEFINTSAFSQELKVNGTSQKRTIIFKLYNRTNINEPVQEYDGNENNFFNDFNFTKKTVIIIGGWEPNENNVAPSFSYLAKAYSEMYDCNMIRVVWYGAKDKSYLKALQQVKEAGLRTARFIDKLVSKYDINLTNLHIIGHSLGAHLSGIAGYNIKSGKVGKVTGLDPATPLIDLSNKNGSISKDSAKLVVVLHTSVFGVTTPIGHVDFYANNGLFQPGCLFSDQPGKRDKMCSHRRAFQLYAEAITNSTGFVSQSCDSYIQYKLGLCKKGVLLHMNEHIPFSARGSYYFHTHKTYPFAEGNHPVFQ